MTRTLRTTSHTHYELGRKIAKAFLVIGCIAGAAILLLALLVLVDGFGSAGITMVLQGLGVLAAAALGYSLTLAIFDCADCLWALRRRAEAESLAQQRADNQSP